MMSLNRGAVTKSMLEIAETLSWQINGYATV
jgi:hypothetical protein